MLSFMARGFFDSSNVMILPLISLVLFMVVFAAVAVRVLRTNKETHAEIAALPLADDEKAGER